MCHVLALLRWHDAQQQLYAEMVDDSIASDQRPSVSESVGGEARM